ncbi:MAG: hypothetical protein LUQ60_07460 [Methanomicrobiales archaeon]|nr:hypothetical protein [Methanomicrobiales archaeon]
METGKTEPAREIMLDFARLTGLDPPAAVLKRYLWTDAFAVCNLFGLYREKEDITLRDLALRLVDQVHHTLGRHRPDDQRTGWISGLGEEEGERHPTVGGLRIGKRLPERRRDDPASEQLEWDQDGQYYHYLTKWMHALRQVGRVTWDPVHLRWAMELAKTSHARFTCAPPHQAGKAMHWKMSIDLSYPLVPSMGQHDPLDGLVTYCDLQLASRHSADPASFPDLRAEIADMQGILRGMDLATDDPLGTGGLLTDALRITQIMAGGAPGSTREPVPDLDLPGLLGDVLEASLFGLDAFADSGCPGLPADYRLAFRELGLSIGLSGVDGLLHLMHEGPGRFGDDSSLLVQAEALHQYLPLGEAITRFWTEDRNQEAGSWSEHREINMVMLATSLAPEGYLGMV